MIALEQLEEMFAGMRAKTPWNVDGPMLWGYFFTCSRKEPLKSAEQHLLGLEYRFVDAHQTEDGAVWILHMERSEAHTPQTLYESNRQLEELANSYGLDSYDGMDVGPLPS